MGVITRRLFLRHGATASIAASAVAIPMLVEAKTITPRERLDAAIEELKAAAEVIWPNANDWMVKLEASPSMPLFINAYDPKWDESGALKATREVLLKKQGTVKFYSDDGSPLLADDVTGTTAYADWEKRRKRS